MSDREWAVATNAVEKELVEQHVRWCGSGCVHLSDAAEEVRS